MAKISLLILIKTFLAKIDPKIGGHLQNIYT